VGIVHRIFLILVACGSSTTTVDALREHPPEQPYVTLQACFDDHHKVDVLAVEDAIRACCLDHPIGDEVNNVVCGGSLAACESYIAANLASVDATSAEIADGCTRYLSSR
jgi:hypothetical protein